MGFEDRPTEKQYNYIVHLIDSGRRWGDPKIEELFPDNRVLMPNGEHANLWMADLERRIRKCDMDRNTASEAIQRLLDGDLDTYRWIYAITNEVAKKEFWNDKMSLATNYN